MAVNKDAYLELTNKLKQKNVTLVAVSKTKPVEDILALYELGQRDFGENYVQELTEKQAQLPADIRWHFIGHLQTNKVKYIAPFIHLIQSVDSLKLLTEINKQAQKNNRVINGLLQVHIAQEETKFGFDEEELNDAINKLSNLQLQNISVKGLMGMASFTGDMNKVRDEFKYLKSLSDNFKKSISPRLHDAVGEGNTKYEILSMGMSSDYKIAVEEGSNMVRIGSILFGARA